MFSPQTWITLLAISCTATIGATILIVAASIQGNRMATRQELQTHQIPTETYQQNGSAQPSDATLYNQNTNESPA